MLCVTVKAARELKNVQSIGTQDPYCCLSAGIGGQRVKTKVHENGGARAIWGSQFLFNVSACMQDHLYVEVRNKNLTDSKFIGSGKVPISTVPATASDVWYPIFDSKGKPAGHVNLELRLENGGAATGPAVPVSVSPVSTPAPSSPQQQQTMYPVSQPVYTQQQVPQPMYAQQQQPVQPMYLQQPVPQPVYLQQQPVMYQPAHISNYQNPPTAFPVTQPVVYSAPGSFLPPHIEERRAPDGRTYYVDHNTRTTSWTRPY